MSEIAVKAPASAEPEWFQTTHWSVVLAAGERASFQVTESLEWLCRTYWRPLYAFVRRKGYAREDAEDLTQAFFAHLLEKPHLQTVSPGKGKFRTFLLCSFGHFLANEWDKARCLKRGGGKPLLRLEMTEEDPFFEISAGGSVRYLVRLMTAWGLVWVGAGTVRAACGERQEIAGTSGPGRVVPAPFAKFGTA